MAGGLADKQPAPATPPTGRAAALLDRIWLTLRRPPLLALAALLLLALLLAARTIPQVPGQFVEDPAAAQRWLNAEADRWGGLGAAMAQLGLFAVESSPLFFVALVLVALPALVHLADAARAARALRGLPAALAAAPAGHTVDTTAWPDPLHRQRAAQPSPPAALVPELEALLAARFDSTQRHELGETAPPAETRLLARRRPWAIILRVLLPLGLLLGCLGLWANTLWGWSATPPELAPGDTFALEERDLAVEYLPAAVGATVEAPLIVRRGARATGLQLHGRAGLPGLSARAASGSPALLLTARDAVLARPDDTEPRAAVGLLFPQVGSEQVVVLPAAGAGVRAVRLAPAAEARAPAARYLIELFSPDAVAPVARVEITDTRTLTLPAGSSSVALQVMPTTGAHVTVERRPVAWLTWLGFVLALVGAAGRLLPAGFAVVQVRPWPDERSEVTIQTTDNRLVQVALQDHAAVRDHAARTGHAPAAAAAGDLPPR